MIQWPQSLLLLIWLSAITPSMVKSEETASLRTAARSPAEAIETFQIHSGFEMQLIAAEPLVTDPVAIEYDEDGRAYVAEMRDYPYTDASSDRPFTDRTADLPLGRIRLLTDDNGDGSFDSGTIFADELSWPSGLAVWRGGVFVAATPDLWYFKDTNGDGRADERRRVFSGFRKFNVQALINNLKFGLDHRVYAAGSSNGGLVVSQNDIENPIPLATQDFRFDPLTLKFDPLAGGGRFGNSFDDWGERFICNIRNPIRHIVVPDDWTVLNPLLHSPAPVHDVAASGDTIPVYRISPPEPWRVINAQRLASAVDQASPRSESVAAGYMTSACGLTFYRGSAYPPEFYGQAFLAEPAANLIHRQQVVRHGTSFRSERIDVQCEFVASRDNWFRPVNFVNAPDGTLHVADMYRETIEHPWSIPDDIKARLDLESGRDRGRIYRLAPVGFKPPRIPKLSQLTSAELVTLLVHPDAWRRDTAHRLLFERQDRAAAAALRDLLRQRVAANQLGGQPDFNAVGRVLALWSLDGLGVLSREDLELALNDPVPQIRRHAIRLAALHKLEQVPEELTADPDPSVRAEVTWAISAAQQLPPLQRLGKLCEQDTADPWLRSGIVAAAKSQHAQLLIQLIETNDASVSAQLDVALLKQLAVQAGQGGNAEQMTRLLQAARDSNASIVFAVVSGCAQGLNSADPPTALSQLIVAGDLRDWLTEQFAIALAEAVREDAGIESRVASVDLLRHTDFETAASVLKSLLSAAQLTRLQVAAVGAMASFSDPSVSDTLIEHYANLGPEAQQQAVESLCRADRVPRLLTAFEQDQINFASLPLAQRMLLLRSSNPDIKARVVALVEQQQATPRAKVIEEYAAVLPSLTGDRDRGSAVFRRVCSSCHRMQQVGADLGPALETVQHRSAAELLIAILDPSRELLPDYREYAVVLKDGRVITGVISNESPASITFKKTGAIEQQVPRDQIDEILTSGKSIMPEGLERELTFQEMADLTTYLRQPGNNRAVTPQ